MPSLALLIWPFCAMVLARQLPFEKALIWGSLVPYLFLPENFSINLPGLPDLDKMVIISIGILLIFVMNRNKLPPPPPESGAPLLRMLLFVAVSMVLVAPVLTALNNQETLRFGPTVVPGLPLWDGLSQMFSVALMLVPYYFARRYLSTPEAHREMLFALVIMGLIYSVLMLVELRLSPQLHNWTYGFHQHSFKQHIRDGYRPMMFLKHGLFVGFFIFTCVIAALGLWKAGQGGKYLAAAAWLFLILTMSENLGATAIGFLMVGLYLFTGRWIQILAALSIGFIVFFFPIFRGVGLIPVEQISEAAATISEERSRSLNYRLRNEDALLARALEKPVTGWGRWGRNQVYDESGESVSTQEGVWIKAITETGWFGYLGLFGVLTLPAMFSIAIWRRKFIPPETFALIAIITGNLIYMIPTTTLTPLGWVIFGALAGFTLTPAQTVKEDADEVDADAPRSRYTRFSQDRPAQTRQRPVHQRRVSRST